MRTQRYPKVEQVTDYSVDGLTLTTTVSKSLTFTLTQLKHGCTADKLIIGTPYTREQVTDLLKSIARQNRFELFGTHEPYKIIFNGYGQLKSMERSDGTHKMNVEQIFNILSNCYGEL